MNATKATTYPSPAFQIGGSAGDPQSRRLDLNDAKHLVAVVVDDLYGNLAGLGRGKRTALRTVERGPGSLVNLSSEGLLELLVGLIRPGEVGNPSTRAEAVSRFSKMNPRPAPSQSMVQVDGPFSERTVINLPWKFRFLLPEPV
jgi:hypothetical protein